MSDIILPKGWEKKKLVNISDVKGGKRLPKGYELSDSFNGFPYIRVADMYMGGINLENIKYVPLEVVESIKNYKITVDDLFISVAGTIGIVGEVPSALNNANLTENADKITNIKIDKGYLLEYLKSSIIQSVILREMTTSAQPKLAIERIKKIEIRYPQDRKEQQKIAEILSTINKNIEKTIETIEKYKKIKNGLMGDLLTGKIRIKDGKWVKETEFKYIDGIGNIPTSWEVKMLSDITTFIKDGTHGTHKDIPGGIPLLSAKDIYNNKVNIPVDCRRISYEDYSNIHKKYIIQKNDILLTIVGTIGRAASVSDMNRRFTVQRSVSIIRVNSENISKYILNYINFYKYQNQLDRLVNASAQGGIYLGTLGATLIVIPDKEEQNEISNILEKQDQLIEKEEQYLKKLQKLKSGLMDDLLTGRKRVNID